MSKEFKVIQSNIQPNHKEAEIWTTPTSNNGTKQLKYWNQKSQSWEGGDGGETVKYVCILYKGMNESKTIVGNFDFSTLQKGEKILIVLNFDYSKYTQGTYMATFEECEKAGTAYMAIYQVNFEGFPDIAMLDSPDISSSCTLN